MDKKIQIFHQGKIIFTGIAKGCNENGQLCILTSSGLHSLTVGDVSIKIQP